MKSAAGKKSQETDVMTTMQGDVDVMASSWTPTTKDNLLWRLEGELRSATPARSKTEGLRFDDELDARIVAGRFEHGSVTGLERFTIASDGTVRLRGAHTSRTAGSSFSLELQGSIDLDEVLLRPRAESQDAIGYELPDQDVRLSGSALMSSSGRGDAQHDGTPATVEGWLNFVSGELELEAHAM